MRVLNCWKHQDEQRSDRIQIIFEDGTTLIWLPMAPARDLSVQGEGPLLTTIERFVSTYNGRFDGSLVDFLFAIEASFPPRPLPDPVPGFDLIGEEQLPDGGWVFSFTGEVTVTYWSRIGRMQVHASETGRALALAINQAFPSGMSLLDVSEMRNTLADLCDSLPQASANDPQIYQQRGPRAGALYMLWYPYDTVRHAYREGEPCQPEVLEAWLATLRAAAEQPAAHRHLLVNAPTGLGKTSAALAPALAWQQHRKDERQIYYVVTTVNQHENPIAELQRIYDRRQVRGLAARLHVVDLVGQTQAHDDHTFCRSPGAKPTNLRCAVSRRTASWDRLPDRPVSWREVCDLLRGSDICPYHFLQGLMATADVVICDYWWVFDANAAAIWARTSQFGSRQVALIVDEAHRLIPRVRSARDVVISRGDLRRTLETTQNHAARDALMPLLNLLFLGGILDGTAARDGLSPATLRAHLNIELLREAQKFYAVLRSAASESDTMTVDERILENLLSTDSDDENIVIYTVAEQPTRLNPIPPEPTLHIRRVDASAILATAYSRVYASLTLSATMMAPKDPEEELRALIPQFGLPQDQTAVLKAASPFDPSNQLWVYSSLPLGTYDYRRDYYPYYAHTITDIGKVTPDITAVFFSSYQFLEGVLEQLPAAERARVICETRADASGPNVAGSLEGYEQQLRDLISQPGADGSRGYLFAVYPGKLAQGANFGDNLIKTVVCISVPAEMVSLFHQRLCSKLWPLLYPGEAPPTVSLADTSRTHTTAWGDAWRYAYERPAMYQVLQAVGRGIRSAQDRCAFVLLDRRYHDFTWHSFLVPEPFHTEFPQNQIRAFHQGAPERFLAATDRWEPLLTTIKPF